MREGHRAPQEGPQAALPLKEPVWAVVESPPQSQEGGSSYPHPTGLPHFCFPSEVSSPCCTHRVASADTDTPFRPFIVPHADQAGVCGQEGGMWLGSCNLPSLV